MFATLNDVAVFEHFVETGTQTFDCRVQMCQFLLHVVSNEIGHHDARLVQHDMP